MISNHMVVNVYHAVSVRLLTADFYLFIVLHVGGFAADRKR